MVCTHLVGDTHACLSRGGLTPGVSCMSGHRGERETNTGCHRCNQSWQPLIQLIPLKKQNHVSTLLPLPPPAGAKKRGKGVQTRRGTRRRGLRAEAGLRDREALGACERGSVWMIRTIQAREASGVSGHPSLRPSARTKPSESHTFLPSLTQSMLGGAVSRATKRHLSLTTVQDVGAASISLHLRCGRRRRRL